MVLNESQKQFDVAGVFISNLKAQLAYHIGNPIGLERSKNNVVST